jgi:CheY-like chemotaxis protein
MKLTRETLRVLLVDDDYLDRELLAGTLSEAGFTNFLTHLKNGWVALDYFRHTKAENSEVPHIILLDVNMPVVDGVAALESLRQNSSHRDLPVMMLSANPNPLTQHEIAQLGIFRFVEKQLDFSAVVAALDDFIDFYNHELAGKSQAELP